MLKKLLGTSLLLSASFSLAMNQGRPIVVLGSIKNQNTDPQDSLKLRIGAQPAFKLETGDSRTLNMDLFSIQADKDIPVSTQLVSEEHYLIIGRFYSYTVNLEMQEGRLKIIKNFGVDPEPEETHPLKDGKKYLLKVSFQADDTVLTELLEDNN